MNDDDIILLGLEADCAALAVDAAWADEQESRYRRARRLVQAALAVAEAAVDRGLHRDRDGGHVEDPFSGAVREYIRAKILFAAGGGL